MWSYKKEVEGKKKPKQKQPSQIRLTTKLLQWSILFRTISNLNKSPGKVLSLGWCLLKTSKPLKGSFPLHQVLRLHSLSQVPQPAVFPYCLFFLPPLLFSHSNFVLLAHFCSLQHRLLLSYSEIVWALSIFNTALRISKFNPVPVKEVLWFIMNFASWFLSLLLFLLGWP